MANIFKGLLTYKNLIIVLILLVLIDLITRCWGFFHLPFDLNNSQIFNNIASPIISILGFGAVLFSIREMRKQNTEVRSLDLYNFYKDKETEFFKIINQEIMFYGVLNPAPLLEADNLIIELFSRLNSCELTIKKFEPQGMGIDTTIIDRDNIKDFILGDYTQRMIQLNQVFIKHVKEIENNQLLLRHYKETLINNIISKYFLSYIKICERKYIVNYEFIEMISIGFIDDFYSLYNFLVRNDEYQNIISTLVQKFPKKRQPIYQ